jgi:archaellum component FlaF (FlaF/FlaG flagellin family)
MNTRKSLMALALYAAAVLATTFFNFSTARAARADETISEPRRMVSITPSVGLASGETLRVNFLNVGSNPLEIIPCIFDADGEHIKTGAALTLLPGQTRSLDLSYAEAATRGGGPTVRVRAGAHIADADLKSLAASGEVIDDATGMIRLFVQGALNAQDLARDEPSATELGGGTLTRSVAPVGIIEGQMIRVSFVNVGSNPFEIIPCIFDGDGVHLKTGALVVIAPGQTLSFEMSSAEAPTPGVSRLLVRGAVHVRNADARSLLITGEVVDGSSGRSALFLPGTAIAPEYTRQQ